MPRTRGFDFDSARPLIEQALSAAGYDLIDDPAEPNLVQARHGDVGDASSVVVDAGGRMRFIRVRQIGPEEATERRLAPRRSASAVHRTDETLTVILQLKPTDAQGFAELLAEMETLQ
jgi:hypothetical protein